MSIRKVLASLAVASTLVTGISPATADEVDPDPTTTTGYNDGENGFQTVTVNVALPSARGGNDVLLKIAGDCEYTTVGVPNSPTDTNLVLVGHATTTVHGAYGVPVSTAVNCRVYNSYGELRAERALPLNSTAAANTGVMTYGVFTMCISVAVHYESTAYVRSREVCRNPIPLP